MTKLLSPEWCRSRRINAGLIAYGVAKKLEAQARRLSLRVSARNTFWTSRISPQRSRSKAPCGSSRFLSRSSGQIIYQNDMALKDVFMGPGIYPMPLGTPGISAVDIRDIAEAAAIALTTEGHEGKTYNLNGPEF